MQLSVSLAFDSQLFRKAFKNKMKNFCPDYNKMKMSAQANTSVHLETMCSKDNLCVGSVVTLFLLFLIVVLLVFLFPVTNIIQFQFESIIWIRISKRFKVARHTAQIAINFNIIYSHFPNFQIIANGTMLDAKVTLRSSFDFCCYILKNKANLFEGSLYLSSCLRRFGLSLILSSLCLENDF